MFVKKYKAQFLLSHVLLFVARTIVISHVHSSVCTQHPIIFLIVYWVIIESVDSWWSRLLVSFMVLIIGWRLSNDGACMHSKECEIFINAQIVSFILPGSFRAFPLGTTVTVSSSGDACSKHKTYIAAALCSIHFWWPDKLAAQASNINFQLWFRSRRELSAIGNYRLLWATNYTVYCDLQWL